MEGKDPDATQIRKVGNHRHVGLDHLIPLFESVFVTWSSIDGSNQPKVLVATSDDGSYIISNDDSEYAL